MSERKLPPDDIIRFDVKMRVERSQAALARRYGVSRRTMHEKLRRLGIAKDREAPIRRNPDRASKLPQRDDEFLAALKGAGSMAELSRQFGCAVATVQRRKERIDARGGRA